MPTEPNLRDLLTCVVARQQQLVGDAALESLLGRWMAAPSGSLADFLAVHGKLSHEQSCRLRAAVDRQAAETCVDPIGVHLRALPAKIQRLVGGHLSDVVLATDVDAAATRQDSQAPSAGGGKAVRSLTPGERFEVQQVHAQGGLGVVFLARDQEIDRTVALKQIKSQWADDDNSRARFLLEARITGRLEHPGIVPIYALGTDATGRPYYAMRLIRGESLLEVIERFHRKGGAAGREGDRLPELRKLLQRFIDVCHAVDYAHSKGVIHRDLKPSNIMVGKYGETLVVDWGLAKVIGSDEDVALTTRMVKPTESEGDGTSTRVGATIGTPAYMSPEQAAGRNDELSPATDVYSLGATLYHLLTGALPHAVDDDFGVMIAKVGANVVTPPRARAGWLPRPLESICMRALGDKPEARYVSARALAEDVERWLADEPVRAHPEGFYARSARWMRRHQTLVTSLGVAYAVAAAAIVVGIIGWNHLQAQRRQAEEAPVRQQSTAR